MEENTLPSIIFEHACKHEFKNTINCVVENEELASKLVTDFSSSEKKVKPIFILTYLLKKLYSSNLLVENNVIREELSDILPTYISLLETTYLQCNFLSLKKYFTLISELKLLDLLCSIVKNLDSSNILQKLNQYFPRWTATHKALMEKNFCIENSKVLDKVEESHAQCRKLILKLAVDIPYRKKYLSEQYSGDIERIVKESKEYIKEAFSTLHSSVGSSTLEKIINEEEKIDEVKDLSTQLLFEYIQPQLSDDSLVRFLEDLEQTLNSTQTSGLASCLLPFDSMSEDEDSDLSESEYELSQGGSQN